MPSRSLFYHFQSRLGLVHFEASTISQSWLFILSCHQSFVPSLSLFHHFYSRPDLVHLEASPPPPVVKLYPLDTRYCRPLDTSVGPIIHSSASWAFFPNEQRGAHILSRRGHPSGRASLVISHTNHCLHYWFGCRKTQWPKSHYLFLIL